MRDLPTRRPGELAIELPPQSDAGLIFIGRIHTPWRERSACPKNVHEARERGQTAEIIVDPRYAPALDGLEAFTHVWVIYWMDRAARDLVQQWPRHLSAPRGTFSLRSPVRPNPIAIAACSLLKRDGNRLTVLGVDCLDGTPLIDLKPYFTSTDSLPEAGKSIS